MTTAKRIPVQFFTDKELKLVLCNDGFVYSFQTEYITSVDAGGARIQTEAIVYTRRFEYENVPQD